MSSGETSAAAELTEIHQGVAGKLLRILKLFKIFDRLAEESRFNPASFRLVTLAVSLFFMSHLFGCLWYMVIAWGAPHTGTLVEYAMMANGTADHLGAPP